jgi:arginyl-tRNA synthetase
MSIPTYGLQDIKKELQHLPAAEMGELLLRLARYKKENKELLAYILFDANNEAAFIEKVKAESGFMFSQLPSRSYDAAKSLRKILRLLTKYTNEFLPQLCGLYRPENILQALTHDSQQAIT